MIEIIILFFFTTVINISQKVASQSRELPVRYKNCLQ